MHKDVPPVPFGQSTDLMRDAWRRDIWAYRGLHGVEALPRVGIMYEVAYAYAMGWTDGRYGESIGGAKRDFAAWDRAANYALRFASEYERQEFLYLTGRIHTKHGYGLVWEDVVHMHNL